LAFKTCDARILVLTKPLFEVVTLGRVKRNWRLFSVKERPTKDAALLISSAEVPSDAKVVVVLMPVVIKLMPPSSEYSMLVMVIGVGEKLQPGDASSVLNLIELI
jgi:hypothetical protein